ncbi:SPFH domain-containing protein [Periweissella cryptocerci]|uniref:SPFH domain-containing protein n=1 Tax=Periweissella cryptocerci TaxID=2506420 RepID=A0A4P6YSQ7_9LACO|nr:SPFH domain-containing protein [Periweissella cryptocerci]QBO35758.1 SPFH domain-containing protein [Periweissella cryptocerci]
MGMLNSITGAISGTLADQWKDIITAGPFDEHTVVAPGVFKQTNNGRGTNYSGSEGVITNGSKIFVPENTAAFTFSGAGIEDVITEPGEFEYSNGQESVFDGDTVSSAIFNQVKDRIKFGGQTDSQKQIAFVNLREIRGIKFGTHGPLIYNDLFYGADLGIQSYGSFSIKITNAEKFIRNYLPANVSSYSFDNSEARSQILAEFLQSFTIALTKLSKSYRISELSAQANDIAKAVVDDSHNAGSWDERFGFKLIKVGIESLELSHDSRELVKQYSANKMSTKAYEDVSQKTANIAAQQKIAQGIQDNGLGDGAGMMFGMNMAQNLGNNAEQKSGMTFDQQIDALKKLKELLDANILSQDEFDAKKKEIMGL